MKIKKIPHKRILLPLTLFIMCVAFVGQNIFMGMAAYNASSGDVYVEPPDSMKAHAVGETFQLQVYAFVPAQPAGTQRARLDITWTSEDAKVQFISCKLPNGTTCSGGSNHPSQTSAGGGRTKSFSACIIFPPSAFGNNRTPLFTLTYKSKFDGPYGVGNWRGWDTQQCNGNEVMQIAQGNLWGQCGRSGTESPCSGSGSGGNPGSNPSPTNPPANNPGSQTGAVGNNNGQQGNGNGIGRGTAPGPNPGNTNQGQTPTPTPTPTPTSSPSLAASASPTQRQSQTKGAIATIREKLTGRVASNSAQGTTPQQTTITASPFYDGKEYAKAAYTNATKDGFDIRNPRLWPYLGGFIIVAIVVVLGGAIAYYRFKAFHQTPGAFIQK